MTFDVAAFCDPGIDIPVLNAAAFCDPAFETEIDPFDTGIPRPVKKVTDLPISAAAQRILDDCPVDAYGFTVPPFFRFALRKQWDALDKRERLTKSRAFQREVILLCAKEERAKNPAPATRYTTDYAVALGRKRGWKLNDRERYDFRTKRHHDLACGSDASFRSLTGLVLVQGAGVGEKAVHYKRFLDRGGVDEARKLGATVYYWEFARGNKTPVLEEIWFDANKK